MPTIATIIGARPQFIKCAPVSREIRKHFNEILIHTGQHYDYNMSQAFFKELAIPEPDYNLGIGSGNHGEQTGRMLIELEKVLLRIKPDLVMVYGDTNSTMAGALVAAKLQLPLAHIEAGLRSFNRDMPEEINRIVADALAQFLFVPTQTAIKHLQNEGITKGVYWVGDVMYDSFLFNLSRVDFEAVLKKYGVTPKKFILTTIHRPQNTDDPTILKALINTLEHLDEPILFPVHPRTMKFIRHQQLTIKNSHLRLIEPVGYLDMLALEKSARIILTDSGGVQKEAYFAGVPCLVLRTETEWVELVENGWAKLIGTDFQRIPEEIAKASNFTSVQTNIFGDGTASIQITAILKNIR
jgi:UDP-N-acetylglucosamine 2-epimerase